MIFGLNSVEAKSSKVWIAGGTFTPLYGFGKKEKTEYRVAPFFLDLYPVTRRDFFLFLKKNPAWQKGKVDLLYADESYLKEFELNRLPRSPVVYVSWFAAEAYCRAQGGRLPTVLEWELVAAASEIKANASRDPDFVEQILKWYSLPAGMQKLREVGQGHPNFYGLYDLHGLVWEWTQDFNSVFVTGDNRQDGDKSLATVCGAGATDASSRSDYAAFMRYAMRSSVEARFSQGNLGFRCAYDKK